MPCAAPHLTSSILGMGLRDWMRAPLHPCSTRHPRVQHARARAQRPAPPPPRTCTSSILGLGLKDWMRARSRSSSGTWSTLSWTSVPSDLTSTVRASPTFAAGGRCNGMVFRYTTRLRGALASRRGRCGKMARWGPCPPGTMNVPEAAGVARHRRWRVLPIVTAYGPGLMVVMVGSAFPL